ncbi:MAG: hypothetical protein O6852_00195, partial [Gammaproteobacteria bacterium]|nr:hypothetical protein [Gammaproteobacteria bacterium]
DSRREFHVIANYYETAWMQVVGPCKERLPNFVLGKKCPWGATLKLDSLGKLQAHESIRGSLN